MPKPLNISETYRRNLIQMLERILGKAAVGIRERAIVNSLFRLLLRGREGIYLYKVLRKRTIDTANFLNELESKIKLISLTLFTSPFSGD